MKNINPKVLKEYDIRGIYPEEIDDEDGYRIGYAFIKLKKFKKIVVCRDKRLESAKMARAFIKGAYDAGARIYDLGINGSPAMFFAVGVRKFDAGVMFTPSHNPDGYTGIKFCTRDGDAIGLRTGLRELIKVANKINIKPSKKKVKTFPENILREYENYSRNMVDFSKVKGLKVVLDASDGSGSVLASHIFSKLKVKTIKMNFVANDKYPKHGLNPMLAENCQSISDEVKKQKADLGLIWDGDADRIIFIDNHGNCAPAYFINCLLYQIIMLKFGHLKNNLPLVLDARMPLNMSQIIKNMGGKPLVTRSGYVNILKRMKQTSCIYSSENSGHYFFNLSLSDKKRNFIFEDGIITALLVMEYMVSGGISLSESLSNFRDSYVISGEINLKVKDFKVLKNKIIRLYNGHKISQIDGLSVFGSDWCFNIRPSKTEPLVRLNIESISEKSIQIQKEKLLKIIR